MTELIPVDRQLPQSQNGGTIPRRNKIPARALKSYFLAIWFRRTKLGFDMTAILFSPEQGAYKRAGRRR
jgi:hypothetical protein